jgi:hypothetical protein
MKKPQKDSTPDLFPEEVGSIKDQIGSLTEFTSKQVLLGILGKLTLRPKLTWREFIEQIDDAVKITNINRKG